ncbi:MAG: DUF2922 domain-containing protein [Clostridiaceae bacterium]|nr:DUF2922 domain-containing protein [Clostridiaceae bacterium]MCC5912717.1 DUF2922 domain-containing protein [Clostridiaceae bacterium]
MDKYLRMVFKTDQDSTAGIRVSIPRDDLMDNEVKAVMEAIIASGAVHSNAGNLVEIDSAYIVQTATTELDVVEA